MMDRDDIEEIVRGILAERDYPDDDEEDVVTHMVAIEPFDGEDLSDDPLRVVGVAHRNGGLEWIAMRELEHGELVPSFEPSVWRKAAA